jgi:hypothetical protein
VDFKPGSSRVVTNRAIHNTKSHDTWLIAQCTNCIKQVLMLKLSKTDT